MMSDNEILVFLGTCCIILMLILGKVNGIKKIFSHLILFMSYTLFFVYNLVYKGQYGTSLVWFTALALAYLIHIFLLIVYLLIQLFKKIINK